MARVPSTRPPIAVEPDEERITEWLGMKFSNSGAEAGHVDGDNRPHEVMLIVPGKG